MKEKLKMKRQKNTLKATLLGLGCLAFLPQMQGVSPPPDGCYPNSTTAEGCKALQSLTTGAANTAIVLYSLFATDSGSYNTAVGAGALDLNTADNNTAVGVAALLLNTTGINNTANGVGALFFNNTAEENTATPEHLPCIATLKVTSTRPTAHSRSISIPQVSGIRPSVTARCTAIL